MSFKKDNSAYEAWLRTQCVVVAADLDHKHERMRLDPFVFLRATYFRWARTIEAVCPELTGAPDVLAVGDTHTENFGTWRDREGRLIWGVNDFDEAAVMPYAYDLVRLAASARLAPERVCGNHTAADAIRDGYAKGLTDPRPMLLDEQETWMRPYVACSDKDRRKFWKEARDYPTADPDPPAAVRDGLRDSLPKQARIQRFATRRKGSGGLGRPRYVAIAEWRGGLIVREAKALVPSAWHWAHGTEPPPSPLSELATGPYRAPDPFLKVRAGFVFRRIAADSRKVELGADAGEQLHGDLLRAMGRDLGAIHAADPQRAAAIRLDLEGRADSWLHDAAGAAAAAVERDFKNWQD